MRLFAPGCQPNGIACPVNNGRTWQNIMPEREWARMCVCKLNTFVEQNELRVKFTFESMQTWTTPQKPVWMEVCFDKQHVLDVDSLYNRILGDKEPNQCTVFIVYRV